ncbi:hypothetical protein AVEN_275774-1 [Araneus ventricosus]|uniref:Uncharacterized protein n=1 Tax=Araneus ventricosus TaxID=182803 RepID=A0A4Y2HEL0_ARAVE|nr:hypothetical protein AVEN_275774-1 [Araneus ventricosus]
MGGRSCFPFFLGDGMRMVEPWIQRRRVGKRELHPSNDAVVVEIGELSGESRISTALRLEWKFVYLECDCIEQSSQPVVRVPLGCAKDQLGVRELKVGNGGHKKTYGIKNDTEFCFPKFT